MANDVAVADTQPGPSTDPLVDPSSDAALMRQVIAGSHDALAHLYDRHVDAVFSAAWRTSRDRWVAADIVQETFLALWNRAELYDPARGSLPSWLLTIARNRAVDHLRAAGRHDRADSFSAFERDGGDDQGVAERLTASGDLIGAASQDPVPEIALSLKEMQSSLAEAIARLSPVERTVIMLAYAGGLSQAEIADRLGWPLGTVKTRTRRALGVLRQLLEPPGADEPIARTDGIARRLPVGPSVEAPPGRGTPRPGTEAAVRSAIVSRPVAWSPAGPSGNAPCVSPCA